MVPTLLFYQLLLVALALICLVRVLIIQQVLPPPGRAAFRDMLFEGTMSDLNMLVFLGGHDRTEAEYVALLEAAGFTVTQVIPTRSLMSIVEGTRA
jgi:hypothetical protein